MKLYYSTGACSLASHIVLEEIAEPYERELVLIREGAMKTKKYLNINSKGRVPALETNDGIITESSAILTFLALTYPKHNLIENTPLGFARTIEWLSWLSSGIHSLPIGQLWHTEWLSDDLNCHVGIQTKGLENLKAIYSDVDRRLTASKWATGDFYSIVDPYLLVFYRWGNVFGLDMEDDYKNWTRHANQMLEREAVNTIFNIEGISI